MVWIVALEIRGVCADVVKILKRNLSYRSYVDGQRNLKKEGETRS